MMDIIYEYLKGSNKVDYWLLALLEKNLENTQDLGECLKTIPVSAQFIPREQKQILLNRINSDSKNRLIWSQSIEAIQLGDGDMNTVCSTWLSIMTNEKTSREFQKLFVQCLNIITQIRKKFYLKKH